MPAQRKPTRSALNTRPIATSGGRECPARLKNRTSYCIDVPLPVAHARINKVRLNSLVEPLEIPNRCRQAAGILGQVPAGCEDSQAGAGKLPGLSARLPVRIRSP